MTVRVVFADGSRKMGNNTNDQRERWELRRDITESNIRQESITGYSIPTLDQYEDISEMLAMKSIYLEMQAAIDARVRVVVNKSPSLRDHLLMAREEVIALQRTLSEYLKNARVRESNSEIARVKEVLVMYSHLLEQMLINEGIELPPPPLKNWKVGIYDKQDR